MTAPTTLDHLGVSTPKMSVVVGRTGVSATDPAKLRAARERAGLTQDQLAQRLGKVSPANVRAWESGSRRPEVYTLRRLAVVLGVQVRDLLVDGTPLDLRYLRARVGRTQDQVAHLAEMPRPRYAAIERAERPPTDEEVAALATALSDELAPTTVEDVRAAYAAGGADWPTPGRPVELPGDLAARVSAVRQPGESFGDALKRLIESGLGDQGQSQ